MSKVLIYAELLSNIRQISVIASLDTPSDASTKVQLSANGQEVILHHQGRTASLSLSGQVAPSPRLQQPVLGSKELSWRLPLRESFARSNAESATNNEAPWPAMETAQDAENHEFYCSSCGAVILKGGVLRHWRDLPSENWAEMMDFWHCHKPDIPEAKGNEHDGHFHEDPNASRGYGANTKFTAQSGIGFVDLTTFLVAESDCSEVEVSCFFRISISQFSQSGYQEGGQALLSRFNGLVTDTNTPHRHLHFPFHFGGRPSRLPSSSDDGFGDWLEVETSAFHSVSSSISWKAMGLARGTYINYVAIEPFL